MEKLPNKEGANQNEELEKMRESLEKLRKYVEQGYLLHGSKNKLEVIEPRQAKEDNPERMVGSLHGIYATENLKAPILMALFAKKDLSKDSWRSSYDSEDGEKFIVSGENFTFTPGYVHILPPDTFKLVADEKGNSELVSNEPVKPIDTIYIAPSILKLFEDITILEE